MSSDKELEGLTRPPDLIGHAGAGPIHGGPTLEPTRLRGSSPNTLVLDTKGTPPRSYVYV